MKDSIWVEYYADGVLRRKLYFDKGRLDISSTKRDLPILIFDTDSLKVGVTTHIRAIHFYSYEGLMCNKGIIFPTKDKDLFDFTITPTDTDTVQLSYFHPYLSDNDTIEVMVSDIKDPSKYGLSEDDLKGHQAITVVNENSKTVSLKPMPVYR